jgi:hypothetical protein
LSARAAFDGISPDFRRTCEVTSTIRVAMDDQCVRLGMSLEAGQCYGFKVPPLFGGEYEPENIAPIDLAQNYAFLADIWSQTKEMPDGTQVRLVIGPHPNSH